MNESRYKMVLMSDADVALDVALDRLIDRAVAESMVYCRTQNCRKLIPANDPDGTCHACTHAAIDAREDEDARRENDE